MSIARSPIWPISPIPLDPQPHLRVRAVAISVRTAGCAAGRTSQGTNMSKTVVVTGASTGIGFATSVALAKAGYDVFAGVRSEAAGEPLRKASAPTRGKIPPITLDVTDAASVAAAAGQVKAALGGEPLFGLANNAGIGL